MKQFKGFTNINCEFYPCHTGVNKSFNCLFCYCPLIAYQCPGPYKVFTDKTGTIRKDCFNCSLPHNGIDQSWRFIQLWLSKPILWDSTPQTPEKLRSVTKQAREYFDFDVIKWAENNAN